MVLTLIFFLLLVNKKYGNENKRNMNKDGKIFIIIQIVFMEQWLFLRVSKVYQWETEQFDGSSVDFFFGKKFKLTSKLAHRLQKERLMYLLTVESGDWIH